jgi:hypothetical protein
MFTQIAMMMLNAEGAATKLCQEAFTQARMVMRRAIKHGRLESSYYCPFF